MIEPQITFPARKAERLHLALTLARDMCLGNPDASELEACADRDSYEEWQRLIDLLEGQTTLV